MEEHLVEELVVVRTVGGMERLESSAECQPPKSEKVPKWLIWAIVGLFVAILLVLGALIWWQTSQRSVGSVAGDAAAGSGQEQSGDDNDAGSSAGGNDAGSSGGDDEGSASGNDGAEVGQLPDDSGAAPQTAQHVVDEWAIGKGVAVAVYGLDDKWALATTGVGAEDLLAEIIKIWNDAGANTAERVKYLSSLWERPSSSQGWLSGFPDNAVIYNQVGLDAQQRRYDAVIVAMGGKNYAAVAVTDEAASNTATISGLKELGEALQRVLINPEK
ncbi:MAG: hypothetical protein LBM12_02400 [Candidatus Nomurabacteria bacterium]|jgi:hypothetical protein|nr:hypothetical protein [Candidatus Nomurabacteria bacterium]